MSKGKVIGKAAAIVAVIAAVTVCALFTLPTIGRKRAVILVPGLLASGLVDSETGEPVWDPFVSEWTLMEFFDSDTQLKMIVDLAATAISGGMLEDIINNSEDSIFNKIALDEDGTPINENVIPADFDAYSGNQRYGAFQSFREAYDGYSARYGSVSDVKVFNYDWRIDNRINAERLERYIEEKGYTEVVLVGHSMGNIVISNYLARSEANRDRTLAHVSYAGPYYGSLMALSVLEDFDGMAEGILNMLDGIPIVGASLKKAVREAFDTQFRPLGMNLTTLVQLLPSPELAATPHYREGESCITEEGKPVATKEELLEFYSSREWSFNERGELKSFIADLGDYWDSFYVETEDGRVHASSLVDTYYFAGGGCNTEMTVNITDGVFTSSVFGNEGDGTVPLQSATGPYAQANKARSCVYVLEETDHFGCGCYFGDELRKESFEFTDRALRYRIAR